MTKLLQGILEKSKITRNTTFKIVSILFALVLWLYVMGEVNPEDDKMLNDIKVQLLNVEEVKNSGLVIIEQEDFYVDVKISGRRNELYNISTNDIKVTADLRGFPQGINNVQLDISSPANITIEDIRPQQIKVRLDKVVKRQKTVEVIQKGKPANNYESGEVIITPSEVLVEGPESKVNAVAKVVGEINIDGAYENVRRNIPIKAVDNENNEVAGVEVRTKYVNAFLAMLKKRSVVIKPEIIGKVKEGYKITKIDVEPKVVELKGKEETVKQFTEILTEKINVDGLEKTLITEAKLLKPTDIETPKLKGLPKVTIEIEKIESKELTFNADEISINNLNNTLTTNIGEIDKDIKVKIKDVRSVLEDVKRSDLELSINVEGLQEGTHIVPIKLNKKREFEGIEILPKDIEIEIYNKNVNEIKDAVDPNIDNPLNEDTNNGKLDENDGRPGN